MEQYVMRTFEELAARASGWLSFRLLQPSVAIILAIRTARRDARMHHPAFLETVVDDRDARAPLLHEAWTEISRLQAIILATLLAVVPYVLIRGPLSRMMQSRYT